MHQGGRKARVYGGEVYPSVGALALALGGRTRGKPRILAKSTSTPLHRVYEQHRLLYFLDSGPNYRLFVPATAPEFAHNILREHCISGGHDREWRSSNDRWQGYKFTQDNSHAFRELLQRGFLLVDTLPE